MVQVVIDFTGLLRQNTAMRRVIAWNAVAALVMATFSAPLFHLHSDAGHAPLIHAHFPQLEVVADIESGPHMEPPHSHGETRSIDILTTTAAHSFQFDAITPSNPVSLCPRPAFRGFVAATVPRAHAPPGLGSLIPRAPPA